jgi:hypothetical protein
MPHDHFYQFFVEMLTQTDPHANLKSADEDKRASVCVTQIVDDIVKNYQFAAAYQDWYEFAAKVEQVVKANGFDEVTQTSMILSGERLTVTFWKAFLKNLARPEQMDFCRWMRDELLQNFNELEATDPAEQWDQFQQIFSEIYSKYIAENIQANSYRIKDPESTKERPRSKGSDHLPRRKEETRRGRDRMSRSPLRTPSRSTEPVKKARDQDDRYTKQSSSHSKRERPNRCTHCGNYHRGNCIHKERKHPNHNPRGSTPWPDSDQGKLVAKYFRGRTSLCPDQYVTVDGDKHDWDKGDTRPRSPQNDDRRESKRSRQVEPVMLNVLTTNHEPLNTCDRSLQGDARSEANPALDQSPETPTEDQGGPRSGQGSGSRGYKGKDRRRD